MLKQLNYKRKLWLSVFLVSLILVPLGVWAATTDYYEGSLVPCGVKGDFCTLCHFVLLAKNIFQFILKISLAFAILIGAIAGVMYITSSGTENLMNAAKQAIKMALLGFLFCLLAWVLVGITAKLMGYQENWWSLEMECDDYKNVLEDLRLGCDEYNKELIGSPEVSKIIEDKEGCEADKYCEYDEEEELCVASEEEVSECGSIDLSKVSWLDQDISDWEETANLESVSISGDYIMLPYDKANVWPAEEEDGTEVNANPWIFVCQDKKWYAGTWEWLRPGQTAKAASAISGGLKTPPINGHTPESGEQYGFMVSGLARLGMENVEERSNFQMLTWP